jgi:hypothetical protein
MHSRNLRVERGNARMQLCDVEFHWAISCATAASAPESFSSALAIPRSVAVATI